jgi:hypothetical protein
MTTDNGSVQQIRDLIADARQKPLNDGNIYESVRNLWAAVELLTDQLESGASSQQSL